MNNTQKNSSSWRNRSWSRTAQHNTWNYCTFCCQEDNTCLNTQSRNHRSHQSVWNLGSKYFRERTCPPNNTMMTFCTPRWAYKAYLKCLESPHLSCLKGWAGLSRGLEGAIGPAMWAVERVCCFLLHFGFQESWFEIHLDLIWNLHLYSKYLLLV